MTGFDDQIGKILDEQEEYLAITNPKEPFRTFLRKLAYRWSVLKERLCQAKRTTSRPQGHVPLETSGNAAAPSGTTSSTNS